MTKTLTAAGYIIHDVEGWAIYGVGKTIDEAWAMVVDGVGADSFCNDAGDKISPDEAFKTQFVAYEATAALMEKVEQEGGEIAWGKVGGVACTRDEERGEEESE